MTEIEIMNENKEIKGEPDAARLFDSAAAALEYMKQQQAANPGDVITCTFIALYGVEMPADNRNLEAVAELLEEYGPDHMKAAAQLWQALDGMETLGDIADFYDDYLLEYIKE